MQVDRRWQEVMPIIVAAKQRWKIKNGAKSNWKMTPMAGNLASACGRISINKKKKKREKEKERWDKYLEDWAMGKLKR